MQCWEAVKVFRVRRREGREEKRADGFRRAMMAVLVVMVGGGVRFDGQDLICRENRSHGVDGYVIFFSLRGGTVNWRAALGLPCSLFLHWQRRPVVSIALREEKKGFNILWL